MDWSAIFAGIAALVSIFGLVYSVRQHQDNIRKEFILWALEQMQSPEQRDARGYIWHLHRKENKGKKRVFIKGIISGAPKILDGEGYAKIRMVFALFNQIGYFWAKAGYGDLKDVIALFPQILDIWDASESYIEAIRSRPQQSKSYDYFETLALKFKRAEEKAKKNEDKRRKLNAHPQLDR